MNDLSDRATENQSKRTHLSFDPKTRFPVKLYDVANDGFLVKWNPNGTSIFVEEGLFEDRAMKYYPGFVQIASFLNLRRLFREYSFDWQIVEGTETLFEFSHPDFIRDRQDLLDKVTTKRKTLRRPFNLKRSLEPFATSSPKWGGKRRYRRRTLNETRSLHFDKYSGSSSSSSSVEQADSSFTLSATGSSSDFSQTTSCKEHSGIPDLVESSSLQLYSSTRILNSSGGGYGDRPTQQDLLNVLAVYAKNELTEEEYLQLLANIAVDEQVICHEDTAARESISSQSVPPFSWPEFFPFDPALQGGGDLEQWSMSGGVLEAFDANGFMSHTCSNDADYIQSQADGNVEYGYGPTTCSEGDTSNEMDCNLEAAYGENPEQLECEDGLCEADESSTLCELRSSLFDHGPARGQACGQPVQAAADTQRSFVDLDLCDSVACTSAGNSVCCEQSEPPFRSESREYGQEELCGSIALPVEYEQEIPVSESR